MTRTLLVALLLARPLVAQCPDGTPPPCTHAARTVAAAVSPTSVAVLYFATRDTADAYLADGLTEDIATSLGRVERVQVKTPSSVRRAQRAAPGDVRGIARALGVRYVVDGGLRRTPAGYRVTIRLVNAQNETSTWGETYDRSAADLLGLPAEVAQAVASSVAGTLAPTERATVAARPTRDPRAWDHLLRGNFLLAQRTGPTAAAALAEYEQALSLDSTLAPALARMSLAYHLVNYWGWEYRGLPRESLIARGRAVAERALRLDSTSSDAWLARANMLQAVDPRAFAGALQAYQRALALDPRNAEAWHQYGTTLRDLGRDSEAVAAFQRALAIEPLRPITLHNLALMGMIRRQLDSALVWLDSGLAADPTFAISLYSRANVLSRLGRGAEARRDLALLDRVMPSGPLVDAAHALVEGNLGDTATARTFATRALAGFDPGTAPSAVDAAVVAPALLAAGMREATIAFIERARPRGAWLYTQLRLALLEPIRDDPRFRRVMDESRPPGVTP